MMLKGLVAAVFIALSMSGAAAKGAADGIWRGWTGDLFTDARSQDRFVILDLKAVWCHWCHVMEAETYQDPEVLRLLNEKYIAVRVDQDANPDLSSRYGDWGWPATIVFGPDGSEIVKLRGYIPAPRMASLLQAIIDDPSPGPSVIKEAPVEASATAFLTKAQRDHLLGNYDGVWDEKFAGWGQVQKFIHTDSLDYALAGALNGDEAAARRAKRTLDAALALFDPVWGGIYQYSDERDWNSLHYEKIMWYQAQAMRQYALAYSIWGEERYLEAARSAQRYLADFMTSPEGAFYTSQDADLNREVSGKIFYALNASGRKALGMPRIDTNIYARDNGWAISGLVALYNASGDREALDRALAAARWILASRRIDTGGFRHGENDRAGPYLAGSLAMAQALVDLYAATGDRMWLIEADRTGRFIAETFAEADAGYMTAAEKEAGVGVFTKPFIQVEENIQLARLANLLFRYTGKDIHRATAEHAMRYLTSEQVTAMRRFLVGVVLSEDELGSEPIHITVIGAKDDPSARKLHSAARAYPAIYKRVDWWDRREGPMLNADITYPKLDRAAAFACGNKICSLPVYSPDGLDEAVRRIARLERGETGQ